MPNHADIEVPLLRVLITLGGRAHARDVIKHVTTMFPQVTQDDLTALQPGGTKRWDNRVRWVKETLKQKGELTSGGRGYWVVTTIGENRVEEALSRHSDENTLPTQEVHPRRFRKQIGQHDTTTFAELAITRLRRGVVSEREQVRRERVGQDYLRRLILEAYNRCCAFCAMREVKGLKTAHIIRWSWTNQVDIRLDPANAILLCPTHDFLFEEGLIGLSSDLRLVVSPLLDLVRSPSLRSFVEGVEFRCPSNQRLAPAVSYLSEHRQRHLLADEP